MGVGVFIEVEASATFVTALRTLERLLVGMDYSVLAQVELSCESLATFVAFEGSFSPVCV